MSASSRFNALELIMRRCLLFAKTGTELLLLTVIGQNQFNRWQSWLIVLILAAAGVAQVCEQRLFVALPNKANSSGI